jgi:pyrimidine operon attenuation protein/uracil phosphoribosyltransferase
LANEASPQTGPGRKTARKPSEDREASGGSGPPGRETVVLDDLGIRRALMRIAHEIVERNDDLEHIYLVAIPNSGVPLGRRLRDNLAEVAGQTPPLGILDTTLYRDDLVSRGARPRLRRTEMPSSVDERSVILVEDVVSTGRTIRAAMDALMDFGRPEAVQVVALIDRGHRELPIKIDYVGKNIPTRREQRVVLRGRDGSLDGPLEVVVVDGSEEGGDT